jgi:putative spermidine/putrescine transport system permease protein
MAYCFLLPVPLLVATFYLAPLVGVLGWSVTMPPEVGLGHYGEIAGSPLIRAILFRTLRVCTLTTLISLPIAYVLAYHLRFGPSWKRRLVEICVLVPFWLSVLIRAFAWLVILRGDGLVNASLMAAQLIAEPLPLVRNELGVVIGMVHFMVPYAVFPLLSSMEQIDDALLRAARGLGAGYWTVMRSVFVPLTAFGIAAAAIIVFVFSLGFFVTPAVLGGGRVVMAAEYIYVQMFNVSNWGLGAALSIVLMAVVVAAGALVVRVSGVRRLLPATKR